MKKEYIKPSVSVQEIKTDDIIAAHYTENGDNNTDWLDNWASVLG